MMWFRKRDRSVLCRASVLFEILEDNLREALCTDILFEAEGRKHRFGAWGDAGNTIRNVVFYLDGQEYRTLEEFREKARLDGVPLAEFQTPLKVTECDGCYPESTPRLKSLMR